MKLPGSSQKQERVRNKPGSGSGSGLSPLKRMPIVEQARLLRGAVWDPSPGSTWLLKPSTPHAACGVQALLLLDPQIPSLPLPINSSKSSQHESSESRRSLL